MTGYKEETFPQESFLNSALPFLNVRKTKDIFQLSCPARLSIKGAPARSKPFSMVSPVNPRLKRRFIPHESYELSFFSISP
jgi:hypothetical protein